ncbi:MAG: glycosyltransferase [Opitutales bacterium]|nr:glycosyltransferase [Opitutales bacterium]
MKDHERTLVFTSAEPKRAARGWRRHYERAGVRVVTLKELQAHAETHDVHPEQERFLQGSWMVYRWLADEAFDLVHFQDWCANGFYSIRARRMGLALTNTRLAVTVHAPSEWIRRGMHEWPEDTVAHLRLHYAERYCVEHSDAAVFPSAHMREWCREEGWRIPEEHSIIHCPYTGDGNARPSPPVAKPDPAHLIFFGRLEARKGLDIFLDALQQILSAETSHGIERISFVGKDGRLSGEVGSEQIKRLQKVTPKVDWRVLTNLDMQGALDYLCESRGIVWMPSRLDNCPYTVVECIEEGIPFFAAATGGVPELVHPAQTFPLSVDGIIETIQRRREVINTAPQHPYSAKAVNGMWQDWHNKEKRRPAPIPLREAPRHKLPKVTVCVPYFNQPAFLPHTLRALQRIDYPELEVIVVNDGSTDREATNTWSKMREQHRKAGWTFLDLEVNRGLGAARNAAAHRATGEYLIFNDSNNCAFPEMIERFARAMQRSGADCLTCGFIRHHSKSDPFETPRPGKVTRPLGAFTLLGLLDNVYGDANFCIRRDVFEAVGGFREERDTNTHDWELLLRLDLNGRDVDVIPTELFWYRHLPDAMMLRADPYQSHHAAIQSWLSSGESLRDHHLFNQLPLFLFHERQRLRKSISRLPKFLQRWIGQRRP